MRKLFVLSAFLFAVAFTFAGPARAVAGCPGVDGWSFNDVSAVDPFCPAITAMAQQGITGGCEIIDDNHRNYCPNAQVSRLQMAAFMKRLIDAVGTGQLFASVSSDGSVLRGRHATTGNKLSTGVYEVAFDRDITSCGYTVTVGEGTVGGAQPGQTGVTLRSGNPNGLFIRTLDKDGLIADFAYFVIVIC